MEAFTYVERVRGIGDELRPESTKERQHVFPCRIDEGYVGYVDEQYHSVKAARYERASILSVITSESAFKLESHSALRIMYLDA